VQHNDTVLTVRTIFRRECSGNYKLKAKFVRLTPLQDQWTGDYLITFNQLQDLFIFKFVYTGD